MAHSVSKSALLKDPKFWFGIALVTYVVLWTFANRGMLFDPLVQNDDAQTVLFSFHEFSGEKAFEDDPLAEEMLAFMPPTMVAVFSTLSAVVGVLVATKLVQAVCVLIVLVAAGIGWRARPSAGPIWAVMLLFLILHTELIWFRGIGGGLPRAFAFPWMFLWAAGLMSTSRKTRAIAIVGAALTYPSAMLILLVSEGLASLGALTTRRSKQTFVDHVFWLTTLTVTCLLVIAPVLLGDKPSGPIHTLAQASQEPAFGQEGRLKVLPLGAFIPEIVKATIKPFEPGGGFLWSGALAQHWTPLVAIAFGGLVLGGGAARVVFRQTPFPSASFCIAIASVLLYAAARIFAFHLYSPERFAGFGLAAAVVVYLPEVYARSRISDIGTGAFSAKTPAVLAFAVSVILVVFTGDGIDPGRNGGTIDGRDYGAMGRYMQTLPARGTLVAAHPSDANEVPFWGKRKVLISYETLQPWFVSAWDRQKRAAQDVLDAMYAIDCGPIERLVSNYGVSHILVNLNRYNQDFLDRSRLFEPFDSWLEARLQGIDETQLIVPRLVRGAKVITLNKLILADAGTVLSNCEQERPVNGS